MASLTKYMKLRQYIANVIDEQMSGETPLMSEREMCRAFGIARTTVRRALKPFIDSETIIPRHGKGLFINPAMYWHNYRQRKRQYRVLYIHGAGRNAFFDSWEQHVLSRITDAMWRRNLRMLFCNFIGEPGDEREEIEMYHPDAVIWIRPSRGCHELIGNLREKIPVCVVAGAPGIWGFSETLDYTAAGEMAAEWFLEREISRVLYACGAGRNEITQRFLDGFQNAFRKRGLEHDSVLLLDQNTDIRLAIENAEVPEFDGIFSFLSFYPAVGTALRSIGRTACPTVLDSADYIRYPELPAPAAWVELYPRVLFDGAVEHLCRALGDAEFPRCETVWKPEIMTSSDTTVKKQSEREKK